MLILLRGACSISVIIAAGVLADQLADRDASGRAGG